MAISQETGPQARTHSSCRSSAARWARCWPKPVPPEEPVMKFDAPAGRNPIDRKRVVTRPVNRIDGPPKASGQARYAYEYREEAPNAAYGVIVGAGIVTVRITTIDTRRP